MTGRKWILLFRDKIKRFLQGDHWKTEEFEKDITSEMLITFSAENIRKSLLIMFPSRIIQKIKRACVCKNYFCFASFSL